MAHAVFISYAAADKKAAYDVCSNFESRGIQCWIAPRDIAPGDDFQEAIVDAIGASKLIVLILSSSANASPHVKNEVTDAGDRGKTFITFRIEDVEPSKAIGYYIKRFQRLDAFDRNLKDCLQELANAVENKIVLPKPDTETVRSETKRPPIPKKQRSFLFWLGLIFFVGSLGAMTALCTIEMIAAANYKANMEVGVILLWNLPSMLLGILLIWLSRRKLRKRWFWPGLVLFSMGFASLPGWMAIWERFKNYAGPTPHFGLTAAGLAAIIGTVCLYKGWPREGVRHPRREFSIFMIIWLVIIGTSMPLATWGGSSSNEKDILSFSDNFDDGAADGWNLDSGWSVVSDNGNYVLDGQGQNFQWARPKVTDASAYTLEADFKLITGTLRFNVMYSPSDIRPFRYGVEISNTVISVSKESPADEYSLINSYETTISVNQWHHIQIDANGVNIGIYIDNQLVLVCRDTNPLSSGSFTIETCQNAHARVDNIAVKSLDTASSQYRNILSFSDNFNDGQADGWNLDSGWSVVSDNGNYVLDGQTQSTGRCARPYITSAENYQIEADFMLMSGKLQINAKESGNHSYIVWMDENAIGVNKDGYTSLSNAMVSTKLNQWHKIKITINGGNIKVYIDQNLVINCNDSDPIYRGTMNLGLLPDNSAHVRVDNIVIQSD